MVLSPLVDQNIPDRVADRLREAIMVGKLKPGERLVERKLAAQLGVSHIPIREALARLADEGLVERLPRRGSRVAALSHADLEEISSLRVLLEEFVALRVQARLDERSEAELRKLVAAMVKAANRKEPGRLFDLDRQFHERLWQLSEHGLLLETVSQLRGRINGFLRAANIALQPDELAAHAQSHVDLLDALGGDDPQRARKAMRDHVRVAAERVAATLPQADA